MAAYGALTSLLQTLDHHNLQLQLQLSLNPQQLATLREKVSFLQSSCMKTRTNRESMEEELEKKIRDVAFQAEDLIAAALIQPHLYQAAKPIYLSLHCSLLLLLLFVFCLVFIIVLNALDIYSHRYVFNPITWIPISIITMVLILMRMIRILGSRSAWPLFIKKMETNLFVRNGTKDRRVFNDIVEDIRRIAEETAAVIREDANNAQLPLTNFPSAPACSSSRYSRIHDLSTDTAVGIDRDLNTLKEMLGYRATLLQIVPIVGMGGIGKTTLAMLVYKDACIRHQFDVCAWATVSQNYYFQRILQDLLISANLPTMQGQSNNGELGNYLHTSFQGKRYLIVLDDVWDVEIWDEVRRFLPQDSNGSRVLLTTRSSEVAHYANSGGPQHQMRFLGENESQRLLHGRVFGEEDCSDELRVIRDEIAQCCKGLPLALMVISGLLSKIARTEDSWRSFADSLLLTSNRDDGDECMETLSLSYNHLPHRLRPCFLYMGMFPEDYTVPVIKLIHLWVAEGFLQPDTGKTPEEVAEEYLEELVERNLILVDSWSSQGKIKTCKIHDVLRKLCLREARKEKFLFVIGSQNDVSETDFDFYRRLSIHPNILETHPNILYEKNLCNSKAHSLMCIRNNLILQDDYFHRYYRPLRELDLLTLHFPEFPLELTKLVSLRYLALSFFGPLHPRISKLQNLLVIVHQNTVSREIFVLPMEIWLIPNLRHIHVPPTKFSDIPNGSSPLSLQTLVEVVNLSFDIQVVDKIKSLKKLCVSYEVGLESFKGWVEHKLENVARLDHLQNLKLMIFSGLSGATYPPNLVFPQSLKKLTLSGCRLPWAHLTIVVALPNLEVLKLRRNACQGEEWEPVEGQFGQLMVLELRHMGIVHWKADETHFPCLQHLTINSCHQLEIPLSIIVKPTFKEIKLVNCHPGIVTSVKHIQEVQEQSTGRSDLKLQIHRQVTGVYMMTDSV